MKVKQDISKEKGRLERKDADQGEIRVYVFKLKFFYKILPWSQRERHKDEKDVQWNIQAKPDTSNNELDQFILSDSFLSEKKHSIFLFLPQWPACLSHETCHVLQHHAHSRDAACTCLFSIPTAIQKQFALLPPLHQCFLWELFLYPSWKHRYTRALPKSCRLLLVFTDSTRSELLSVLLRDNPVPGLRCSAMKELCRVSYQQWVMDVESRRAQLADPGC